LKKVGRFETGRNKPYSMMINEGSSGKVFAYGQAEVVKVAKRGVRGNLGIREQYKMHHYVHSVLTHGEYKILYTPRPLGCLGNSYKMERIDDRAMIVGAAVATMPALVEELARLYEELGQRNITPNDFELYLQADGRVALIDFDKFVVCD
jgi:hypothetical protein